MRVHLFHDSIDGTHCHFKLLYCIVLKYPVCRFAIIQHNGHAINDFIREHVDVFVDLENLDDVAAASVISSYQLHVLVDMNGHTSGRRRTGLLSLQPAPVIICALGYWGPCAAPWSPYIVVDPVSALVVPEASPTMPYLRKLVMPHHTLFMSRPPAEWLPRTVVVTPDKGWMDYVCIIFFSCVFLFWEGDGKSLVCVCLVSSSVFFLSLTKSFCSISEFLFPLNTHTHTHTYTHTHTHIHTQAPTSRRSSSWPGKSMRGTLGCCRPMNLCFATLGPQ